MQRTYELMVLLHPDLEIDVETPITKVESLVQAVHGKVTRRDNWGKKRLAYRIARQDFAIYIYFELQLPPSAVRELERSLLITEEVLRYILVTHEETKAQQSDKSVGDKAEAVATLGAKDETSKPQAEEEKVKEGIR